MPLPSTFNLKTALTWLATAWGDNSLKTTATVAGSVQVKDGGGAVINPAKEDGNLKILSDQVSAADGLKVRSLDAVKFAVTEANSGTIKTAVELVASAVAAIGAAIGTAKALVLGVFDGTNILALRGDASGFLIPKSPTAADFKVEEASASTILNRITTGGQLMLAVQQITQEIQMMRSQTPLPLSWAGNSGTQVSTGAVLTPGAMYEVTCVQWEADDNGSAATTVQVSLGYATGFTPNADQFELYASAVQTFVAGVIGIANPYTMGRPFQADGTGEIYIFPTPDAGTTNGTGTIWVRRIY